jgi:hypothetical protein
LGRKQRRRPSLGINEETEFNQQLTYSGDTQGLLPALTVPAKTRPKRIEA